MLFHTTWLIARLDPIKFIFEKPSLSGRIAMWQVLLSEFDIFYVSQKTIKGSAIVDFLAKRANEEYEPMSFDFLDEDLMAVLQIDKKESPEKNGWKIYFDGASNALGRGIGAVLISSKGNHCLFTAKLSFECTNNVAEYEACVLGLQAAIEKKIKILNVYGDSALVICQLNGEWETRDSKLVPYQEFIKRLIEQFEEITFKHLPCEKNYLLDTLATLATLFKVSTNAEAQLVKLEVRESQAHCACVQEESDANPWYHDILRYVRDQQYPESAIDNDKRTLKRLAMRFFLDGEVFTRKEKTKYC